MKWLWILSLILISLILFLLFVGINISFKIGYKDRKFHLRLRVYILNSILGKDIKFKEKEDKTLSEETTEDISREESEDKKTLREFVSDLKKKVKKYLNYKDAYLMTRDRIRKKFVFKSLNLSIAYGDGNAHTTAVATGTMWGFLYNILSFVTKTSVLREHRETVEPKFNQKIFSFDAEGILRVRCVHIIYTLIIFYINYKKVLSGNKGFPKEKKGV